MLADSLTVSVKWWYGDIFNLISAHKRRSHQSHKSWLQTVSLQLGPVPVGLELFFSSKVTIKILTPNVFCARKPFALCEKNDHLWRWQWFVNLFLGKSFMLCNMMSPKVGKLKNDRLVNAGLGGAAKVSNDPSFFPAQPIFQNLPQSAAGDKVIPLFTCWPKTHYFHTWSRSNIRSNHKRWKCSTNGLSSFNELSIYFFCRNFFSAIWNFSNSLLHKLSPLSFSVISSLQATTSGLHLERRRKNSFQPFIKRVKKLGRGAWSSSSINFFAVRRLSFI